MYKARIQYLCFNILLWATVSGFSQSTRMGDWQEIQLTVQPKTGETAAALLKRYNLYDFPCNISRFFKLNNLKENERLKPGATYKLPVNIASYNGKSIRSTLEIDDWQVAKSIEVYNREALESGLRGDNFIVSKKLWVPWHLVNCADEPEKPEAKPLKTRKSVGGEMYIPEPTAGKGQRIFPIFGKKYEKTPLLSRKLKEKVFYIVSGHGGPDVGAQGKRAGHTLCEDEYAYDVSLRLLRLLISHGATAFMIVRDPDDGIRDEDFLPCDKDETVWGEQEIPYGQRDRLQQRCDIINAMTERNAKAGYVEQTMIEIHVDSRNKDHKTDVFFYYRPNSDISEALARRFHKKFETKYQTKQGQRGFTGTVSSRNLYMLKETIPPRAVYIELGNIRNDWDQQRLVLRNNRQAIANWLLDSLLEEP